MEENEEREELSKICNLVVRAAWWCLVACLGQETDGVPGIHEEGQVSREEGALSRRGAGCE